MPRARFEKGLIQVYTGNGKGKTTAALGLALRAIGHGFKVSVIQFLKGGGYTGELYAAQRLYPNLEFRQYGICDPYSALIRQGEADGFPIKKRFAKKEGQLEENRKLVKMAFEAAERAICSEEFDLVILDEINTAFHLDLLPVDDIINLLAIKPSNVEVVLTGRHAPPEIIERADLVTEMNLIKHPYKNGVPSRRGIEY